MPPGFSGSPGITSSSPVENSATRRRRNTVSRAAPTEAATPTCGGRQPRAGGQHLGAGRDVLAAAADPLARMRHMVHGHGHRPPRAQLLHHHRIGAGRHRRAGEDARRRAGASEWPTLPAGMRWATAAACPAPARRRSAAHSHPSRCCPAAARRWRNAGPAASTRPAPPAVGTGSVAAHRVRTGQQARQRLFVIKHPLIGETQVTRMKSAIASRSLSSSIGSGQPGQ
jgi:hypothetical protein